MNISTILEEQARERPDALAIIENTEKKITFSELWRATGRCAGLLREAGLQRGDRVLLIHPIAIDLYIFLIALFRIGAVAVILDPAAGMEHLDRCCRLCRPKGFFGSPKAHLLRLKSRSLRQVPLQISSGWILSAINIQNANGRAEDGGSTSLQDEDPALITFTSGSTGLPKAAVRSHGFLVAQYRALQQCLQLAPGHADLTTLPIFVLANLAAGVTSVLPDTDMRFPGNVDAGRLLQQIRQHAIQSTAASPALLARLVEHLETAGEAGPELRDVFVGGAPVFPGLLRRLANSFYNTGVTAVYGSTEAEPIAKIRASEVSEDDWRAMADGRGLLAGKPVASLQVRVIRDRWRQPLGSMDRMTFDSLVQSTDAVGEIVVSGDHVVRGYLGGEGDEETKFEVAGVRWHRTGDLGFFDGCGRLWLLGRCSAKVEDARGTLYPFSVECAALENISIERAALVAHQGHRILAVQTHQSQSLDERELRRRLDWAHLDRVLVLGRIPVDKRHNAKVDYPALHRQLSLRSVDWSD